MVLPNESLCEISHYAGGLRPQKTINHTLGMSLSQFPFFRSSYSYQKFVITCPYGMRFY